MTIRKIGVKGKKGTSNIDTKSNGLDNRYILTIKKQASKYKGVQIR